MLVPLAGPMGQFEVSRIKEFRLFGLDATFTNSALFMVLATVVVSVFLIVAMRSRALIPGRLQSTAELSYEFVANMLRDNVGQEGMKYFPFVFTLFIFILALNMLGMVPGGFTVTSHIIVVTGIGFARHGVGYLRLFVPAGVPWPLLILIVPIEFISYLIRPVSLSVRLFANMLAGHTMLKVFAGFVASLGIVLGIAPLLVMVAFTGFELFVAFIQAFIFAVLTCIYLNDAVNMHDH